MKFWRGAEPIVYGLIVFFGSGVLWFLFSVTAAFEAIAGEAGVSTALMYVFGILFFFSLPVAIIAEVVCWWKRRKIEAAKRNEK